MAANGAPGVVIVPAGLLSLTNIVGTADVHPFPANSPPLDTANPGGCFDVTERLLANDQRGPGFPRVLDGDADATARCDKGAFEFTPQSPLIFANGFE